MASSFLNKTCCHENKRAYSNNMPTSIAPTMPGFSNSDESTFAEKILEIKKAKLKALTALAKSQTILTEIDIAIAEYEVNKVRKYQRKFRRDKKAYASHKNSRNIQSSALGYKQRSPKNYSPRPDQKSRQALKIKPKNVSESVTGSIVCSIPLSKIEQFHKLSAIAKQMLCSQNIASYSASNTNNSNSCPYLPENDQTSCREYRTRDISSGKNSEPGHIANKNMCKSKPLSRLKITHSYNISIIPLQTDYYDCSKQDVDGISK